MSTVIRGKEFSDEEIISKGKSIIKRTANIFRWIGVGGIVTGISYPIIMVANLSGKNIDIVSIALPALTYFVPGLVLFLISFRKRDPYEVGKRSIEKKSPLPTGYNGKIIEILDYDKELILTKKPLSKFLVNSENKKFQIFDKGHYSKILTGSDIIEIEFKQDDEVILNSNTKTKKGVGKAVAGGVLFGGAGLIAGSIGANTKSNTVQRQTVLHHYSLVLRINDILKPSFVLNLDSADVAEDLYTILRIISNKI